MLHPGIWSRSTRQIAAIGAALIALVVLAAAVSAWNQRTTAIRDLRADSTDLSFALAEDASRLIQSVDLVLNEMLEEVHSKHAASSAGLFAALSDAQTKQFLTDRLKHLPQAQSVNSSASMASSSIRQARRCRRCSMYPSATTFGI